VTSIIENWTFVIAQLEKLLLAGVRYLLHKAQLSADLTYGDARNIVRADSHHPTLYLVPLSYDNTVNACCITFAVSLNVTYPSYRWCGLLLTVQLYIYVYMYFLSCIIIKHI